MFEKYLSYGKVVRASFLLLFLISSILCLTIPGEQSGLIAILSLIAFIAFDVTCAFKRPKIKDQTEDIEQLRKEYNELHEQFKIIKDDLSVAKIGTVLGQMRK